MNKLNYSAILLIILLICSFPVYASNPQQDTIHGVINNYARIISIKDSSILTINPSSFKYFKPGDTVLIVQMKGAGVSTGNDSIPNTMVPLVNSTGKYEFIGIEDTSNGVITLSHSLINVYDTSQFVQMVRVPSYQSVLVNSTLTDSAWNIKNGYGGILSFFVNDSIVLHANIDITGSGFRGAPFTLDSGGCPNPSPQGINYTTAETDSGGMKGEGLTISTFPFTRGIGSNINGGGGGNGNYSGGAGGGNFGTGGYGGIPVSSFCSDPNIAQPGYIDLPYFGNIDTDKIYHDRIFMGGGGGGGSGPAAAINIGGGNGGGIVFIITRFIRSNGFAIKSNGGSVTAIAPDNDGAGGGGGGGFVVVSADSIYDPLNLQVNGGNGGSTRSCTSGPGGGGGSGFVWTSFTSPLINVSFGQMDSSGLSPCGPLSASDGSIIASPYSLGNLQPLLNGFLYNIIDGEVTICYGDSINPIKASIPTGGNYQYKYLWQSSTDAKNWNNCSGVTANRQNYNSGPLFKPTYFRRIVKSLRYLGDPVQTDSIEDISKEFFVNVLPAISNVFISRDTTICQYISIPVYASPPSGGADTGVFSFSWAYRPTGSTNWIKITSKDTGNENFTHVNTLQTVQPNTYYYERILTKNGCPVADSVKIIVDSAIVQPLIPLPKPICVGTLPLPVTSNPVTGGAGKGTYSYQWQESSPDSANWNNIANTDTLKPGNLPNTTNAPIPYWYRRIVYSGLNGKVHTCTDTSNKVYINVEPKISNYNIEFVEVNNNIINIPPDTLLLCQGSSPKFIGYAPFGGIGTFTYKWIRRITPNNWDTLKISDTISSFRSDTLIDLHGSYSFARIVYSGLNLCQATSNVININLLDSIKNNDIQGSSIICQDKHPGLLSQNVLIAGGDGKFTYKWQYLNSTSQWNTAPGLDTLPIYTPPDTLTITTLFRRQVTSGKVCISNSNQATVTVIDSINNAFTAIHYVCENITPKPIIGKTLTGGQLNGNVNPVYRFLWEDSTRNHSWAPVQGVTVSDTNYYPSGPIKETTFYKRIVYGQDSICVSTSAIDTLNLVHPPVITTDYDSSYNYIYNTFRFTDKLIAPHTVNDTDSYWSTSDSWIKFNGSVFNTTVEVNNLHFGVNHVTWNAVSKPMGVCQTIPYGVKILVSDLVRYNAFSPNNDGINDTLVFEGLPNDTVANCELTVYNRWGAVVFSDSHYQNNWVGIDINGEPVPDDTYYYTLKVEFIDGKSGVYVYKGFVVLKR